MRVGTLVLQETQDSVFVTVSYWILTMRHVAIKGTTLPDWNSAFIRRVGEKRALPRLMQFRIGS